MVKKYSILLFIISCMPHLACAADHETSTKVVPTPRHGTGKSQRITKHRDDTHRHVITERAPVGPGPEPAIRDLSAGVTDENRDANDPEILEIEFGVDPENPPVVNPSPHVAYDLLKLYPALEAHPEALDLIAKQFNANPIAPAQIAGGKTRRINLLKFSASPAPAPANQSHDTDPREAQGLVNDTKDDGKKEEVQKPHTTEVDVMGNAIIGMLLTNHASSSKKQTQKRYLTGFGGLIATILCGLIVKYSNGECS